MKRLTKLLQKIDERKTRLDSICPIPPVSLKSLYIIPVERRLAYYEALDAAHVDQHHEPFYTLVAEVVLEGFAPYFRLMGIKPTLNNS